MKTEITEIWIESKHTEGPIIGGKEFTDDNVDVIVTFSDGKRFVGSLFTYDNIKTLTEKNRRTGELLSGKYFWASDLILIDRVDRKSIEAVIEDLIKEGYFHTAFREVT
jgi:hypothetical protein